MSPSLHSFTSLLLLVLVALQHFDLSFTTAIPTQCSIYRTSKPPPPPSSIHTTTPFIYDTSIFDSHLIDMVFLQNTEQHLVYNNGWNRTKHLLDKCRTHGAKLCYAQPLFHDSLLYIQYWLETYGCKCTTVTEQSSPPSDESVWVSVGISVDATQNVDNLIVIQTEQMTAAGWVHQLRPLLEKCAQAKYCVVWEFSESNVVHALDNYKPTVLPTVILPTTTRRSPVPVSVPHVDERTYGYVFYGYGNSRRDPIVQQLDHTLHLTRYTDQSDQSEGFMKSKLCVSVHFYGADSGLELHRLAQHAHLGCLPLYETVGDKAAIEMLETQGVMKFADYDKYVDTARLIVDCIASEPHYMRKQQEYVRQWWSYELEAFDKVLLAFFDEKYAALK